MTLRTLIDESMCEALANDLAVPDRIRTKFRKLVGRPILLNRLRAKLQKLIRDNATEAELERIGRMNREQFWLWLREFIAEYGDEIFALLVLVLKALL